MNIAVIDSDLVGRTSHRFPNLACMKLSGYHKSLGDNVELITDYSMLFINNQDKIKEALLKDINIYDIKNEDIKFELEDGKRKQVNRNARFDKVYISKVFTDTPVPKEILLEQNVQYGGTGFYYDKAEPLQYEIEHHMPDYHLYDEWVELTVKDNINRLEKKKNKTLTNKEIESLYNEFEYYRDFSIGFTTRKCFRGCEFCVNRNYKKVELHSPIEEFYDPSRKYICLLDDNILGYPGWKNIINALNETKRYFQYKQGMDERLLTEEKAQILSSCKYRGDYIFAFDNIEDKDLITEKLKIWKKYCNKTTKFYVFCGFDRNDKWDLEFWKKDIIDTFERIRILMKFGCLPYIMRFNRYEESPYKGTYINLARWCNQPNFFKKKSYREFCEANQGSTKKGECASMKYLSQIEKLYPNIAAQYFDLKFENLNNYKSDKE